MAPHWYRNAVVYQIDPALFRDADADGWGDLRGITQRLDYLRGLGVTCVWLMPFYLSPHKDGGYDVADHLQIDPRFGDVADFVALLEKAEELGLQVLVELVMQHTSDQHRWFQQARRDRGSPYRDYYIWSDTPDAPNAGLQPAFPPVESALWTWDEMAQQYYRHVFYTHEPDLNLANAQVREELYRVMRYWLRLGVSGFRIDAAPFMVEQARLADPRDGGFWLLKDMHDFMVLRRPGAVLMGEVNVPPQQFGEYFGPGGERLTLLLNFWINMHLFLALARDSAEPLLRALAQQPEAPQPARYAIWIRNHDELDLGRLTEAERNEVMQAFAPQPDMRAYNRGIRRRLAPMLKGDARRLALVHAILFSLPGTPIIRYGEEIGMGEDLSLPERLAVRTPMQWSDARNAGFSDFTGPPGPAAPAAISGGDFGYERVNVFAQRAGDDSLLTRTGEMARLRQGLQELGHGRCRAAAVDRPEVLALRHDGDATTVLMLANLAQQPLEVEVGDGDLHGLVDLLSDAPYEAPAPGRPMRVKLNGSGYRWMCRRERVFG
jgi:maltose alpha-D-glucosyltransferase/alpha-amylase